MNKIPVFILIISIVCLLVSAGCVSQDPVIGKWESNEAWSPYSLHGTFIFSEDNTLEYIPKYISDSRIQNSGEIDFVEGLKSRGCWSDNKGILRWESGIFAGVDCYYVTPINSENLVGQFFLDDDVLSTITFCGQTEFLRKK